MRSKRSPNNVVLFHRAAIDVALGFLRSQGISTLDELNAVNGRPLLDTSLWKILEIQGKYGGRFIGEGVRNIEQELQRRVTPSTGTWPERLLVKRFGPRPGGGIWQKSANHCCQLDHVNERSKLITALLKEPERAQEILDHLLLGCVVLKSEHRQLDSLPLDPEDPWCRYRDRDGSILVRVWDRQREEWHDLSPRKMSIAAQQGAAADAASQRG